jgi:valyl-tRNA synthetase
MLLHPTMCFLTLQIYQSYALNMENKIVHKAKFSKAEQQVYLQVGCMGLCAGKLSDCYQ